MSKNYINITNPDLFREACYHLSNYEIIAYDTETTGLNVRKDMIIGFSFTGVKGMGYYYPIFEWDKEKKELLQHESFHAADLALLLGLLKTKKLIMHNASYDIRITANNLKTNILSSLHADTVLMEHTINEDGPFGLKDIAVTRAMELGLDDQDAANQEQLELKESVLRNGGRWAASNKDMYMADLSILAKYACADVDITLRLYHLHTKNLEDQSLTKFFYEDEVMPLYKLVTIRMEHRGVYINMKRLKELYEEIKEDITKLEAEVATAIYKVKTWDKYLHTTLNEEFPVSSKGNFAQMLCTLSGFDLPKSTTGKFSINKKTIAELPDSTGKEFLSTGNAEVLGDAVIRRVQEALYKKENDTKFLINIGSKIQLATLFFKYEELKPLSTTAKGNPQFNDDFVESLAKDYEWASTLRVYNKLGKIRSSYYERFLERTEDGVYYPSFKQHGTSSGRYSSDFQQLPRPKDEDSDDHPLVLKYSDAIRELVIPAPDHVFVDDDYESLEPRCFADDAGDEALIKIFTDNLDMYSVVAIQAEGISDASADKKSPDFLKKKYPQKRQNAKAYALGIRYGMKEFKLSKTLDISTKEADKIISNYFKAFPRLKAKMDSYLKEVKTTGKVSSKFGRVRHLPRAKEIYSKFGDAIADYNNLRTISKKTYISIMDLKDIRKEYNNLLNNALNFPIQTTATSIVNRAAIAMTKRFMENGLNAWVSLQIHDQLVVSCHKSDVDLVKTIVQDCMENTNLLAMPLIAKPEVAMNLREGH